MKKRIIAFILALCLVFTVSACSKDTVKGVSKSIATATGVSTFVSGSYSEEPIWRNYHCAYPFVFAEPLASCVGFTMDYSIIEVTKGDMTGSRYIMEVYGLTTQGNWKLLDSFYPQGLETTVELTFDPVSIEAVAVFCQKQGEYSYSESMVIRDVRYSDTSEAITQSGTPIEGTFSDTKFVRSTGTTYPFELAEPLENCMGFTINYEILDISSGNLDGNFNNAVYVRTTDGKWKYTKTFKLDGSLTVKEIRFDTPISIEAVAVICLKQANVTYSYYFTLTDPVTQ